MIVSLSSGDLDRTRDAAISFADLAGIDGFDFEAFKSSMAILLDSGIGVVLGLESNGRIVGGIGGAAITDLYTAKLIASELFWFIEPENRGDGLLLFEEFEKWAQSRGCQYVHMMALACSMPEVLDRIYKSSGYLPVETSYRKRLA